MKSFKFGNETHIIKFTSKSIMNLSAQGINLGTLGEDLEKNDLTSFYKTVYEGLKSLNPKITLDETLNLLDLYFEDEDNSIETLVLDIMEEFATAMGLGKTFRQEVQSQLEEKKKEV